MDYPIRILHVVGLMGPGGIETMIMNLYRRIDRNLIQFDFLTHYGQEGAFDSEIKSLGGKIYCMPKLKDFKKTYYLAIFKYIKELNLFFDKHREHYIIHGHMTNTASIYMKIAKKYGDRFCIAHSHLTQARPGLPGIVTNILHKFLPKIADAYFSCSLMASKWIFPEDKIKIKGLHILKNGIDSEKYTFNEQIRIRKRSEFALENKFIIGNVARFKLEKNQSFLVDVFLEILKINMNSILLFVGDGEERKNVERKVYLLGIQEKVLFLGIRYDVPDILQAMDAFVLPSLYEGLPVVGIEAQASGLPCFISDGVTVETDVTGNCFFLSVKEKPSVWAQMITNKSKKYVRKNTSQQIINSGYDIKKTAQEMQDFYLETYAVNF